jgi:hypothetical protein
MSIVQIVMDHRDTPAQTAQDLKDRYASKRTAVTQAITGLLPKNRRFSDWRFDGRKVRYSKLDANGQPARTRMTLAIKGKPHQNTQEFHDRVVEALEKLGWEPAVDHGHGHKAQPVKTEDDQVDQTTPELAAPIDQGPATPVAPPQEIEAPEIKVQDDPAVQIRDLRVGDRDQYYGHIFDRSDQIDLLLGTIRAFVESDGHCRYHAVLSGQPGCGKTEMLLSTVRAIGPDHCLVLDGPSTTKAGAELLLTSLERIPPVLVIEEIEKMNQHHLQWLLGVLDERAEIRRTNARDGHVQRDVKVLCLASVNDRAAFKSRLHGALASRFSHEIYFPRANVETLTKIALREIQVAGGNPAWAQPAVLYCVHVEGTWDPRRVRSVALSGRDDLLTGQYQRALAANLAAIRQAERDERQAREARGGRP